MNVNDTFRYLHIGLPEEVLRRKYYGDIQGAISAIDRRLSADNTPEPLRRCLIAQREMIKRLPIDYPLTREAAISLVREHISDFSGEEFDSLVAACRIDWIYVQGKPRYFDRFFETLCKTDASIAARAHIKPVGADGQDGGSGRLDKVIAEMRTHGQAALRLRCRASVRMKDSFFQPGETVRAYLPLPCACDAQSEIKIESVTPAPRCILPETAPQRVIFWEEQMRENHAFTVEFSYVRRARYVDLTRPAPGASSKPTSLDTQELPPHILFTPYLRALSAQLTEGVEAPLERARRLYDFVTLNVKYGFMRPYFGLENIAETCARNLTGDCGVQALLFITLCRCAGVPARWESGWKAEPGFCGAHDWAQFYAEPYGWLYADPSFGGGAVRENNEARRQHYFGNLDPYRMAANTAFQADLGVPKAHWRADPYDNQVGEMETAERGLLYEEFERSKEVLACTAV